MKDQPFLRPPRVHPALIVLACVALTPLARAAPLLPYSNRTKPYSGYSSFIWGDIHTIGMAGATIGMPDSITAAESNPAGLAMILGSVSAQMNFNRLHDEHLQPTESSIRGTQSGAAVSQAPWGFGIGYQTIMREGAAYQSPATLGTVDADVAVGEFRASAARLFLENRLSLGASLTLGTAWREIGTESDASSHLGFRLGALYRLPGHWLIGASFSPSLTYSAGSTASTDVTNFFQPVLAPAIAGLGVGWFPNRYFQAGASLFGVGTTRGAALLSDQRVAVGDVVTLQPRLGAAYVFAEYSNFKAQVDGGTYLEVSRIAGAENRVHQTFGLEITPWFINFGAGLDRADSFLNVLYSVGIDVIRAARALDLIPSDPVGPLGGVMPPPGTVSPRGMTAGMGGKPSTNLGDVKAIIEALPAKIEEKLSGSTTAQKAGQKKSRRKIPRPATP